ncbi:hypothetical protein EDB80DRAFT_690968 [Ilyonectria destructans]|nr:hypothetical protein EDB80DRAFT_690968 [Ilyonectria destructans]
MFLQTVFQVLAASSVVLSAAMANPLPRNPADLVPAADLDVDIDSISTTAIIDEGLTKRDVTYRSTYSITAQCPQAGAVSRTQIFLYDANVGRIISHTNIQNAEEWRLTDTAATQAVVKHRFQQNFGNKVCCYQVLQLSSSAAIKFCSYQVLHTFHITGGSYVPVQDGDGQVSEACIDIGAGGCAAMSLNVCGRTSQSYTYSFNG